MIGSIMILIMEWRILSKLDNIILSEAEKYIQHGKKPIPINEWKKPTIEKWIPWRNEPTIPLEQIKEWFSNPLAIHLAILLDKSLIAIDYDGLGEERLLNRILPRCPKEVQDAYEITARTRTPHGGHVLFRVNPEDFPEGIPEIECWNLLGNGREHNQVLLLSHTKYLVERGISYEPINGIDKLVTLSTDSVTELLIALKRSRSETDAISATIRALLPFYEKTNRNNIVFAVSGYLHKYGLPKYLIHDTFEDLMDLASSDTVQERQERFVVVESTCAKQPDSAEVSGYDKLLEVVNGDDSVILTIQKAFGHLGYFPFNEETADDSKNEAKTDEEKIFKVIDERTRELLTDKHHTAFAAILVNDHIEILPIYSCRFERWVGKLYYETLDKAVSSETLNKICNLLQSKATFSDNIKDLQLRTYKIDIGDGKAAYYYDLTNVLWQAVKITENSWKIENSDDIPIMFRRYANQMPQVYPLSTYLKDIFDQFMNLVNVKDDNNKLLLKCYIISLFIPDIPKPVLMLHGEQGSAKSTLQELIKRTVDPSSITSLIFPREINELIQQLSHNYIAYYDNVSFIKEWISDQLCRAVTGSGFSKRELYSNDDDIIYNFKRCLGFNGINLAASKADLLDRGLIIQLERISNENRRKIEEIWAEFERIKPQLLGYIFDILVKVLRIKNNGGIDLDSKSRMADFEEYAEIISRCMGNEASSFTNAYHKNQQIQTEEVIEGSPVATILVKFIESRYKWVGTASMLLNELETTAESLGIEIQNRLWPRAAHVLTRRLNEIRTNLRAVGISIDYNKDPTTSSRIIEIRKIASEASERPERIDHAQNISKYTDAISDGILNKSNIASVNYTEIHAQNQTSDAKDASDGIMQISRIECKYCTILGYIISFDNSDLLERHTVERHSGWTAFPGPPDLEKYKRELKEKGRFTNG